MNLVKKTLGGVKKVSRAIGKGAGKAANLADDMSVMTKNIAYEFTDAVGEAGQAYQKTRLTSAKVQDEIADGIRDASGKVIKEAKTSGKNATAGASAIGGKAGEGAAASANVPNSRSKYNKNWEKTYDFHGEDGTFYARRGDKKSGYQYFKSSDGGDFVSIGSREYDKSRSEWISNNTRLGKEEAQAALKTDLETARQTAETGVAEHSGISFDSFNDFVRDNPGWAMAGAVGIGVVGANLFDDD